MLILKKILRIAIIIVVVTAPFSIHIAQAQAPSLTEEQIYGNRMNQWLDKLEWAESQDNTNLVYLDVNHKYSYGAFQYQKETWDRYSQEYGIKANIMDPIAQRQLTYDIVKNDPNAWTNWWTSCVKKGVGKPPNYQ